MRLTTNWTYPVLALFILSGACRSDIHPDTPRVPLTQFTLDSVASYGAAEPASVGGDSLVAYGGPALARILDVSEGPKSDVYVLDSDYKKVAIFSRDGSFKRLVLGGFGEGPGEFRLPTALDLDADGRLYVYDYNLQRVAIFDSSGAFIRQIKVDRRLKDVLVEADTVIGTRFPSRDSLVVRFSLVDGSRKASSLPVQDDDLYFSPDGVVARLGRGLDGSVLVASQRPAFWYRSESEAWRQVGSAALPNEPPRVEAGVEHEWGYTLGIGGLRPERIVILYIRNHEAPAFGPPGVYLDVFHETGTYLGTATVPAEWANAFATSRDGEFVYIGLAQPYPHVVKYRLRERPPR